MSGTSKGGKKAAAKLLAKDPDYYRNLAKRAKRPRGGNSTPGSFANDPARASVAGSKGGKKSGEVRRKKGQQKRSQVPGATAGDIRPTSEGVA